MKKINILYIIWSLAQGGAERVVINLAKGLDKTRFNPMVCCLNDRGVFADELEGQGINVIALNKKKKIEISIIKKLMKIIIENNIQIVHTHLFGANFWGRIAAKLVGVPVVIATEHSIASCKNLYMKITDKILANFTDKIIAVSEEVKNSNSQEVGIKKDKFTVIYNGINFDPANGEEKLNALKEELNIYNGLPVLVSIGRLNPVKRINNFINMLEILDKDNIEFKALVVGEGPERKKLQEQGRRLERKGKLVFTGFRRDVDKILEIADLCVVTSKREGLSMVILEAMAKGVIVVATDVGGNKELILNRATGILVPADNIQALVMAIKEVLSNPDLKRNIESKAKEKVEKLFSTERLINNTQVLYNNLLQKR